MAYKKDQGRVARMATFWVLAAFIFYGCTSLRDTLIAMQPETFGRSLGFKIPVLGMEGTVALVVSGLVLALCLWLLHRWENKPKNAEMLIETENELRRVTWPTVEESVNGSWTVVVTVLFLMAYLAASDWVLARIAHRILIG